VVALVAAGCGAGGATKAGQAPPKPPLVLTFASEISGGQPPILDAFADGVRLRTHGRVRIEFKGNYRPGDVRQEQHTIGDVRRARVDLAWVGARAWDAVGVSDFDALIAPFLVDSYPLEDRVFRAGIPNDMMRGVTRAGVVPVGVLPGPLRLVFAIHGRVRRPTDLRDRVAGVIGPLAAQTFTVLGARPRAVAAQTPLDGLDAAEMQASSVANNNYDSDARSLVTNLSLWPRPLVVIASRRAIHALEPAERKAMFEAAAAAARRGIALARREDAEGFGTLCRRHRLQLVAATTAELRAFRRAVQPVYERLQADPRTRRTIRRIEVLKQGLPPDVPYRCAAHQQSFGRAATPLDGTWEMRVSQDFLVRHHPSYLPPPTHEAILLDSGWYRYVLRRGRITYTHRAPLIYVHSTGMFRVRGSTFEIVYTGGHDAGEPELRFRWSLYRGSLTFRPIGRRVPAETTLAPWHRVHG
jgi:TRAP-type C4-dicarboxylate transport system substrate-binding protein